jgi:hypothetical protein
MEPEREPEKPWFLDAAFVVPLSIFIAYFWALSLTIGLYSYFNIPSDFISLTPTVVLAKSREYFATIAFGLILFLAVYFIVSIMEKIPRLACYGYALLAEWSILGLIYEIFKPTNTLRWSISVCVTVFVVVIVSVCMDDLLAFRKHQFEKRGSNIVPPLRNWNVLSVIFILSAVGGGYFYFYYEGRSLGKRANTFYVVKQSAGGSEASEVVYLGNYGDYLLGIPFHRDTKKFETFVILKMPQSDNARITFTRETVGPLQPSKVKPAEANP